MPFTIWDFNIPDETRKKFKKYIDLIIKSATIESKDQKQYWIDALPTMTSEQLDNLLVILNEEKQELEKIENEYNENINKARQKAVTEINQEEIIAKKQAIKMAELADQEKEEKLEEDLLKQLNNMK